MTTKRIAAAVAGAAIAVTAYLTWTVRTGVKGFYSNQYSTISASPSARQAHADWLKRQGANLDAIYGADSRVGTSSQGTLADLIIRERRSGVRSVAMPYSSASSVTSGLNAYNRAVVDSAKIDAVISEIEPYNTNDYAGFYSTIRSVGKWCRANRVMPCVYMGWPSEAAWDSIVVNSDRVFLHCYRASNRMSGIDQYGYVVGRMSTIASKGKARKKKMSVVIIWSCEPERVLDGKVQPAFAYDYFKTATWDSTYKAYMEVYDKYSTTDMKQWLTQDGYMVFVSQYAKQIKP